MVEEWMKNEIPEIDELEQVVSEKGEYIIPVEWSVQSDVRVKADNLKEAIKKVYENIEDLPLDTENVYIDGSYKVGLEGLRAEDIKYYVLNQLKAIGTVRIDENGKIC